MEKTTSRTPRALETREAEARPVYKPPSLLPVPLPQDGYAFRWVRLSILGAPDVKNVSAKFRENWTPVVAKDHPELMLAADKNSEYPDALIVGGLILCKNSVDFVASRRKFYEDRSAEQLESVDNSYLRDNDPRMQKMSERRSRVQFGSE